MPACAGQWPACAVRAERSAGADISCVLGIFWQRCVFFLEIIDAREPRRESDLHGPGTSHQRDHDQRRERERDPSRDARETRDSRDRESRERETEGDDRERQLASGGEVPIKTVCSSLTRIIQYYS